MKYLLLSFMLVTLGLKHLFSQDKRSYFKAEYTTSKSLVTARGNELTSIHFKGILYSKGQQHIFYKIPLYLSEYPKGYIQYEEEGSQIAFGLNTDTLQGLFYHNLDSMIFRYRLDQTTTNSADPGPLNDERRLKPGLKKWELVQEFKTINGLNCQKAINHHTKTLVANWEIWFAVDIPGFPGPWGADAPGLVVEAFCTPWRERFILNSYEFQKEFPDSVFWPAEFNLPFVSRIKSDDDAKEKERKKKLAETVDQ